MLPNFDCSVLASRSHAASIRTPIQGIHFVVMARQRFLGPATGRNLPKLGRAVLGGADEKSGIVGPAYLVHGTDVSCQSINKIPALAGPDLYLFIERSAGKIPSVGRKGNVIDGLLMSRHPFNGVLALRGMPKVDGKVVAARNEPLRLL